MRPTWSGMISFGLVNIPVKVYTATRTNDTSFNYLHKEDNGRVSYKKVCKVCGEELGKDDLVRGYEFQKNNYVTLTNEDLDNVKLESAKSIGILDFVDPEEINPLYYQQAYYLAPDNKGDTPYVLLREALKRTGKVGLGKVVFRSREELVSIRPAGNGLVMDLLHYADEICEPAGIGIPENGANVGDRELDMAELLVNSMVAPFEPEKYKDTYEEALRQMIEQKLEGKEFAAPEAAAEATTNVVDIMAKLKASIEATEKSRPSRKKKSAA